MGKNDIGHELFRYIALGAALVNGLWLMGCDRRIEAQPAPDVPEVSIVAIQPQRIELTTELPGRTSAYRIAEIRPQVNGIIQKRLFEEGSDVKAGQLLYQIDPAPFQAAYDSAKASLGKSQANLSSIKLKAERYKELLVDKAVSQQDYDDAAAAMEQARADIDYWKAAVEAARINFGLHPRHRAHFRAHRQVQCDGRCIGDGVPARVACNHPTTQPHLRGCDPVVR